MFGCNKCGATFDKLVDAKNHIYYSTCVEKEKEDVINKPNHYHKGGIDVLAFLENKLDVPEWAAIYQFNVIKYVTRYKEKAGVKDLRKAQFYLNKMVEMLDIKE